MLKKVVIVGPESTGKSTLARELATHFETGWCPEYAREYLEINGAQYQFEDLLTIARGQIALEEKSTEEAGKSGAPLLFIDTDMLVMKVWCEYVFDNCHEYILKEIASRKYDLYLLCDTDLPWVKDPLREYPDPEPRLELFAMYRDLLVHQNTPWVHIRGNYQERLDLAIESVQRLLRIE